MRLRSPFSIASVLGFIWLTAGPGAAQQAERGVACDEAAEPILLSYGDHTEGCDFLAGVDIDQFAFEAEAGDLVRINVLSGTSGLDPSIEVREPSPPFPLVPLSPSSCTGTTSGGVNFRCSFSSEFTASQSGPHSLKAQEGNEVGSYVLQVERIRPQRTVLSVPYNASIEDGISPGTDVDLFSFEGAENTLVEVSVLSDTNGFDPQIELRDAGGTLLVDPLLDPAFCSGTTSGGVNFRCSFAAEFLLSTPGMHQIAFFDRGGPAPDEAGSYQVSVNCIAGFCPSFRPRVSDNFDLYSTQLDDTGEMGVYSVTAPAGLDEEAVVGSVLGPRAESTGIDEEGGDAFWVLSAMADPTPSKDAAFMIAELPSLTSLAARAGAFATLFQHSQNLEEQAFAVQLAAPPGEDCEIAARFVAVSDNGERVGTPLFVLRPDSGTVNYPVEDFIDELGPVFADKTKILGMNIEYFTDCSGPIDTIIDDPVIDDPVAPTNDLAGEATLVARGPYDGRLSKASKDGSASVGGPDEPDVWYEFTAPLTGVLMVDTCGSGANCLADGNGPEACMDSVLSIHSSIPGTTQNELAANDDWTQTGLSTPACASRGSSLDALVRRTVTKNQTLWVRVSRKAGSVVNPFRVTVPEPGSDLLRGAAVFVCVALGWWRRRRASRST